MKDQIKNIPACAPLLCWDIFMEGYHKTLSSAGDINFLNKLAGKSKWKQAFNFEEKILRFNKSVIVTDSELQIAYATSNLFLMNGYTPAEVIGKTPKMFQGKDTSAETKRIIRDAVIHVLPFETTILNYCKNGQPYNCHIEAYPVFNSKEKLVNFIAFENIA